MKFFSGLILLLCAINVQAEVIPLGQAGYKSKVEPFFKTYCVRCHSGAKNKAKLSLDQLDGDLAGGRHVERWEQILEMVESGAMPPEGEPQPLDAERKDLVTWIEAGLQAYVKQASQVPTGPTARRLTNFEYQNSMRDLLGFELNLVDNLPEDPVKPYHFNNTAEMMLIGPEHLDRYHENARRAMASAIVDPGKPTIHRTAWPLKGKPAVEIGVYKGPGVDEASVSLQSWPSTGEYRIRIKAAAILPAGFEQVPLRLVMGSILRSDAGTGDYAPVGMVHLQNDPEHLQEFEFRGRIENHPIQVGEVTATGQQPPKMLLYAQNLFDNGELNDHRQSAFDSAWSKQAPRILLQSVEFEAPVADVWPPEHHTRILFASPLRESDPAAYVREVLKRFVSRAFRRPATEEEVQRYAKIFDIFDAEFDSLEAAMRETLAMVLISPKFLYHTASEGADAASTRQYELACKLSYFLWGSMPDAELLSLAAAGRLDDPKEIEAQTRRLLADPRALDFIEDFTTQWPSIAKMKAVNINRDLFPRFLYLVHVGERKGQEVLFRPPIRDYMHQETVGFVAELIQRNAGIHNLVDSDFAYLNEPLAAHYGVPGVRGLQLRPVPITPEQHLGGLLTQGSVLVGNSTGSAPHPIYRAVWLREAILGDEVKPPPAEVPALSDSVGDSAATAVTIKDLLARHRQQESCQDCHVRLDPWGIPFERYNAVGQFQPKVPKDGTRVRGVNLKLDQNLSGYQKYLQSINTVVVQADSRVPNGPEILAATSSKRYRRESHPSVVNLRSGPHAYLS